MKMLKNREFGQALIIFLLLLIAPVFFSLNHYYSQRAKLKKELNIALKGLIRDVERSIEIGQLSFEKIQSAIEERGYVDSTYFTDLATRYYLLIPGVRAINWINSEGVISIVYPYISNKPALGKSLFQHPYAKETFKKAYFTRTVQVTPIIPLLQGGDGIAFYYPVVSKGKLLGFVNGVFNIDTLLIFSSHESWREDFRLIVKYGSTVLYPFGVPKKIGKITKTGNLKILDKTWELVVIPTSSKVLSTYDFYSLVGFFGLFLLFSMAVSILYYKSQIREKRDLRIKQRLSRIVEESKNVILITDEEGNIVYANRKSTTIFGQDIIGKNITEIGFHQVKDEKFNMEVIIPPDKYYIVDVLKIKEDSGYEYCYMAHDRKEILKERQELKLETEFLKRYDEIRLRILNEKSFKRGVTKALRMLNRLLYSKGAALYIKNNGKITLFHYFAPANIKLPQEPGLDHPITVSILGNLKLNYEENGEKFLSVPLFARGESVGSLLLVLSPRFQEGELLELIQHDLGYFVYTQKLIEDLHSHKKELELILSLAKALAGIEDFHKGLKKSASVIQKLTGADIIMIGKVFDEKRLLVTHIHLSGKIPIKIGDTLNIKEYKILSSVVKQWQPVKIDSLLALKGGILVDTLKDSGIKSVLYYPLLRTYEHSYIFILGGFKTNQFNSKTIEEMEKIDELIAPYIHIVELIEKLNRSKSLFQFLYSFIKEAADESKMEKVDEILLEMLFKYTRPEYAGLYEIDEENRLFKRLTYKINPELKGLEKILKQLPDFIPFGKGLISTAYERLSPIIVEDTEKTKEFFTYPEVTKFYTPASLMVIPLLQHGETKRLILLESKTPYYFNKDYESVLELLLSTYRYLAELIRNREELAIHLREMELIINNVNTGIFIVDETFTIAKANNAIQEILGKPSKELLGKKCFDVVHHDRKPIPQCPLKNIVVTGAPKSEPEIIYEKTLNKYLKLQLVHLYSKEGKGYYLHTFEDITDIKRYEELLYTLFETVVELSTAKSVDDLAEKLKDSFFLMTRFEAIGFFLNYDDKMERFSKIKYFEKGKEEIPLPKGISELVKLTYLNQAAHYYMIPQDSDSMRENLGIEIKSKGTHVFYPLISGEKAIGVLYLKLREGTELSLTEQEAISVLVRSISLALSNLNLIKDLDKALTSLKKTYTETIKILAETLDKREHETKNHSQRVALLAVRIGMELNLHQNELVELYWGGLLHDIGKIAIPDAILLKTGKLTPTEWRIMRRHVEYGYEIVKHLEFLGKGRDVIHYHHERWDGTGYPEGLKDGIIPLLARIFAVADAYDAMISDRPYQKARSHEEAVEEIKRNSGTQFDPMVVDAFLKISKEELLEIRTKLEVKNMPEMKLFD
ncbi:MAG: HD domain-containing protein [Candidatus Hydrothermae bacterium]|nr:HD domain-containing protein [Candidatus Hydrothermae bacterium]